MVDPCSLSPDYSVRGLDVPVSRSRSIITGLDGDLLSDLFVPPAWEEGANDSVSFVFVG